MDHGFCVVSLYLSALSPTFLQGMVSISDVRFWKVCKPFFDRCNNLHFLIKNVSRSGIDGSHRVPILAISLAIFSQFKFKIPSFLITKAPLWSGALCQRMEGDFFCNQHQVIWFYKFFL